MWNSEFKKMPKGGNKSSEAYWGACQLQYLWKSFFVKIVNSF